jgi:hypothetical protein
MNETNPSEGQWEDGKKWSLGVGQRWKSFETDMHIHIWGRHQYVCLVLINPWVNVNDFSNTCDKFPTLDIHS